MSKWNGMIGFADTVKTESGVWEDVIVENKYYGDILSNHFKYQRASDKINNDINIYYLLKCLYMSPDIIYHID